MESHKLAETIPPMSPDKYESFKASIRDDGQQQPIVLFEGKILDGRHRARALEELGVPADQWKVKTFDGTEDQALTLVRVLNVERRNLTPSQERGTRAALVRELREKGMSTRAIAEATGVSHQQVQKDLVSQVATRLPPDPSPGNPSDSSRSNGKIHVESGAESPGANPPRVTPPSAPAVPPKVTGRDGKQYPASAPAKNGKGKAKGKAKAGRPARPEARPTSREELLRAVEWVVEYAEDLASAKLKTEGEKPWELARRLESLSKRLLFAAMKLRQPR